MSQGQSSRRSFFARLGALAAALLGWRSAKAAASAPPVLPDPHGAARVVGASSTAAYDAYGRVTTLVYDAQPLPRSGPRTAAYSYSYDGSRLGSTAYDIVLEDGKRFVRVTETGPDGKTVSVRDFPF